MSRPRLLLASPHSCVTTSLSQHLRLYLPNEELDHEVDTHAFSCASELFAKLEAIPPEQLRHTMLVLDLGQTASEVWQVANLREAGLAARLVLSYPELYCVFLGPSAPLWERLPGVARPKQCVVEQHHFVHPSRLLDVFELVRLHSRGFRTLFDPTGLRSLLKTVLFATVGGERSRVYTPLSKSRAEHVAAVADEEHPFVYLNSYAAYRAGFRSWLVSTAAEYRRLLTTPPNGHGPSRQGPATFDVLLSDWDLVYPDFEGDPPEKSLLIDEKPPVDRLHHLILITGMRDDEQEQLWTTWANTIRAPKPYGGFFDLLAIENRQGGNVLRERYHDWTSGAKGHKLGAPGQGEPHTAPFARGVVAGCLMARAKHLASQGQNETEAWVHVALLACETKEILGGLSRTTAFEAVALQHEAEVLAEISFFGTLAQSKVDDRLSAIEAEADIVRRVSGGADAESHEARIARFNCLLQAVNTLRKHFSEHQQIEASEDCLRKITEYHDQLERPAVLHRAWSGVGWLRARFGPTSTETPPSPSLPTAVPGKLARLRRKIAAKRLSASWLVSWYPSFASRAGTSLWRLAWVSAVWVGLFAVVYALLLSSVPPMRDEGAAEEHPLSLGLWHSCLTFMLQPSVSQIEQEPLAYNVLRASWWYRSSLFLEALVAYLHLSLLVSVLYRRITKRAP